MLPKCFANSVSDNVVLNKAPKIVKIAAIVVIIATLIQPVLCMPLRVSITIRYVILSSPSQSFGSPVFTFFLNFIDVSVISTCLNVSYNLTLIHCNYTFSKIINHSVIVCCNQYRNALLVNLFQNLHNFH